MAAYSHFVRSNTMCFYYQYVTLYGDGQTAQRLAMQRF